MRLRVSALQRGSQQIMRAEKRWCVGLSVIVLLVLPASALAQVQERFGILVFGASYHYQFRTYEDESGTTKKYEQWNYGAGLEFVIHDGHRNLFTVDGGAYRDSKDNANVFGGPLWRFKFTNRLSAGIGLTLLTSPTYEGPTIVPLPVVTYRLNRVSINAVWLPSGGSDSSAIGFFATLHLGNRAK